ncbi:hypothetical protein PF0711 [Pyrococcus furiosus DSM 3638]|uniref:Citrate transporter-like domain-containing protein n=2 Tax=Pyrococcus furiosus TaxID=2261 RepID=Q8U2W7_PYRFU|nr:hypothetical protein PF0711 [Pyrococcus furiosus DSM 3638]
MVLLLTSRAIELSGAFEWASLKALKFPGGSERRLLALFILVIAVSSAIIMNDTAMFVFVPIVAMTARAAGVNVAKATALSAGSPLLPWAIPRTSSSGRLTNSDFSSLCPRWPPLRGSLAGSSLTLRSHSQKEALRSPRGTHDARR